MQLPSTGFCALIYQVSTLKPVDALSIRLSGKSSRLAKTSRLPRLRRGLPSGVMVFASYDR